MSTHVHKFKFNSEISIGHAHTLFGRTDYMIGINSFHFHYFYEICSYTGHTHYYSGITSLPVKTLNGHVHKIEGILEFNNNHDHCFNNFTFEDIEYYSQKRKRQAYI